MELPLRCVLLLRYNQMLRVKRLREIKKRHRSRSSSRGGSSSRSSSSRGSGFFARRDDTLRCNVGSTSSLGTSSAASASGLKTPAGLPEPLLEAHQLRAETPQGPFSPFEAAAATLDGSLGRFKDTCGYTSHLLNISHLLTEQVKTSEVVRNFISECRQVDLDLYVYICISAFFPKVFHLLYCLITAFAYVDVGSSSELYFTPC